MDTLKQMLCVHFFRNMAQEVFFLYLKKTNPGDKNRDPAIWSMLSFGIPVFDRNSCPCLVCVKIFLGAGRIYKQYLCLSGMMPTSFNTDPPLNPLPQAISRSFSLNNRINLSFSSLPPFFFFHPLAYSAINTEQRERQAWVPLVIFSNEQMQRTGAEHTASARLGVCACKCVCVFVCDSSFIPALPACTADSDSAAQHWGELGQNWPVCLLT